MRGSQHLIQKHGSSVALQMLNRCAGRHLATATRTIFLELAPLPTNDRIPKNHPPGPPPIELSKNRHSRVRATLSQMGDGVSTRILGRGRARPEAVVWRREGSVPAYSLKSPASCLLGDSRKGAEDLICGPGSVPSCSQGRPALVSAASRPPAPTGRLSRLHSLLRRSTWPCWPQLLVVRGRSCLAGN